MPNLRPLIPLHGLSFIRLSDGALTFGATGSVDALIQALVNGQYGDGTMLQWFWGNKPLVTSQDANTMLAVDGTDNTKVASVAFDGAFSGVVHRVPALSITLSGATVPATAIRVSPSSSIVGNGTVTSLSTTAQGQQWTLTCTAAATNGGTFSVSGTIAGALASATVGTPYSAGGIAFTINDGSADFQVGDTITLNTDDWHCGIWSVTVDSSGTPTVTEAPGNGTGYLSNREAIAALPAIPAGSTRIGYVLVHVSNPSPFIPGTTPITDINSTRTTYCISDTLIGSTILPVPTVGSPTSGTTVNASVNWSVLLMMDVAAAEPRWCRLSTPSDTNRVDLRVGAIGSGADLETASLAWNRSHQVRMNPLTASVVEN